MKKNLLWMFAAILACGIMTTSCEKTETEIKPIDGGGGQGEETPVKPVSIKVTYEAKATQTTLDNYALVGTSTLVRYADAEGKIQKETFTGNFKKTLTIPITSKGVDAAFQVLIVPKTREELAALGDDVDVTTTMNFSYLVNYDNNTQSEVFLFTTEKPMGGCSPYNTIYTGATDEKNTYDKYVERFGGFIPAMARVGYKILGDGTYSFTNSSAGFWHENKWAPK